MKKHSFLLTVLAVFSLIFAILISCEIGLGGAVDTEPPTVEITYPQKNVIIKDSFLMSGTCDDETGVASVTLVFENNNTKQQYTYQAKIGEDKKTWSCEINKFDDTTKNYPLPDGKYNVTATAQDTAERTSQASVTYTIDNTAPLLVLENPSTVLNEAGTNLSDAGAFGATIKIKGKVVDAGTDDENNFANGSRLVFTVFDENNNFLAARTLDYVPDSLGVTVAEYAGENSSSDLTEAQKFYSDIYGEKTEGDETKYRKFKISVSDAARTYKGDGTVGSERGNTSDCYYLQDEIYADVNYKYTKTLVDVFTILKKENANYESLTSQENEILTALEKYKHLTDDFKTESEVTEGATWNAPVGTFSVNPSDSPSYEVTSLEPFDSSAESLWTGRKVSSSGSITLLAKCGPNDVPLKSTSFELAVYELDEKGNKISEESKTILPCEWTKNGSSYSGKTTLSSSLVGVTKHYEIVLSGSDEAENAFYNGSTRYCFEVQAGVTPPTFEVSDFLVLKNEALSSEGTVAAPKSGSSIFLKKSTKDASKGIDLIVKGSAKNNSGAAGAGVRVFAQINGEIVDEKTIGGSSSSSDSDDGDSWTLTISGEKLKAGNNNVTFVAEDDVLNQTTKEYTIVLDTEDPVILISNVNNVVTFDKDAKLTVGIETFDVKAGRGYVNDIVTFKGSISDNDAFSDGSWKATYINASGETKELASGEFTSTTLNISVNTAKDDYAADGRELKLEITANDRAGNATTYSYSYDDGNQLIISKLTDYPRITLSNADNSITEKTGVKVGQNLFDQTGNNKISGSVIDDDGLDTIVMQYQGSSENWQDVATLSAGEKSSYSFSQALVDNTSKAKLAEGFYKIRFVATDTAGNTLTTEAFEICISNSAPSITFTNPVKNTEDYKGDSFNATGSLTGMFDTTNSSATILKRGNKVITVGENLTWTDKITYKDDLSDNGTPAEGSGITKAEGSSVYTVEYTVTDIFGRETTDSVKFKVDKTAPVVEVTDAADMAYLGKTKSSIYSFTGTVTEEDVLKTLEYSTDGKEWSASDKVWTSITAQKSWSANIDFSSFGDGDVTVCFRAKDEAGNTSAESDSAKRTIKVISVAPVVTITGVEANGSAITKNADDGVYYVNKTYSISGNVASSAFDSLKYGSNSVNIDDSGNFKVENLAASGSYSFVVTDKAGQTATTSISVVYDSENPKPEVSQVSPLVTSSTIADAVEALKTYKNGAVNGTITLQGTASDNDKVTSTDLKVFKADGSEVTTDGFITKDSGNTATNFKFTVDTTKLEDDKGITLQLISTDRTGNVATVDYPVFVCQETDIPVMTSSNSDLALTDANGIKVGENLFGMGSNTFYLNVSDDDGVKNVTYIVDGNADKSVSLLKDGTSTSFDSSINISNLGDGLHTLKFTVEDVNGKSQSFPAGDAAIQVAFDDDVPELSVTNLGSVTYSQNVIAPANFTLTGSIKDSSGQVTIYRESVDDSNKVSTVDCVKEVTWTDEVTNEEGDCTKKYIALDKFGRKREISIKYSVDVTKPVVKVTDYNSTSYVGSSGVGTFTVAIDEINNLSKVEYSTDGLDWTDSGKKWTSIQAQKSFTTNITLPSTCTKIEFRATDEAGNVSECTSECARGLMVLASPTFGSFTVKADENKITAENETFYLNKAFTISGSYTSKALEALTYNLNGISTKVTSDTADANGSANFSVTGLEAGGNYEFTVTDKAGQTKTARVQVVYDTSEPSVEITSVNDVVRFDQDTTLTVGSETFDVKAGTGYVNGSVTFKGSISDNDAFKSGTWRAYYKDGTTENKLATGTLSSTAINITVDTSANSYAGDGKELYLEIKATDRAGNTTTYSYSYDDGNQLVISKLTDYPRVSLSNADLSVISTENVKSGTNLFNQTDNNKLGIAVTDDDGINKVTVLYKKLDDTNDYATLSEFTVGGKTSDSRQIPLVANSAKLDEGFYNIKIEASDSGSEAKTYTTAPFVICISNSAPSFNFTNPTKNSESFQQYEFTAKGTVTGMLASGTKIYRGKTEINVGNDGSWKDDITCAKLDGNGNVDSYVDLPEWTEDSGTVENNGISTSDGVLYTITYSVEDQFGRKTTDTVSFKSDFVKPVVTINDAATPAYVGTKLTTLYSFTGKVVEANSLKSVEYSFDGKNWVNVGNQKEFNANVDFKAVKDTATDGKITVYFRATDGADLFSNETNDSKRGVIFLADGPVFSDMAVKVGDKELSENEGIYYANNSYTISGKVTSAALDSLKLGSDVLLDENATDGTFSTTISNPTAGTNTYTLVATDKAKQTSSQTIQVVYDVTKPSPQISQVSPLVTNTTVAAAETPLKTYKNGAVNGTITLQGTASDNDKVTSTVLMIYQAKKNVDGETTTIVIDESATGTTKGLICALSASGTDTTYTGKITKDGESVAVITVPTGTTNTANNFRFNVDTSQLTDDSGIILRILTTDRAGNESKTDYPVFICQDTDLPVLTSSNSDVTLTDASGIKVGENLFGMGSNTFYLNVSDDDGVASVYYTVDGGSANELLKDGKSTTFDGTIDISKLGSGEHALRFTVVDKNGKKVFFPTGATAADGKTADQVDADTVATAGSAIQVAYDNDVPVISVTALGDKDYVSGAWAKNAFELKGTVSDSSGEVTIYSVSDNGAKTPITSTKDQTDGSSVDVSKIENCSSSQDWNTSVSGLLDTSDGKYASMTYLASDKYGREASTTINFQVDSQKPVFNSSNISITGSVPENGTPQSKTYYLGTNGSNDVYPDADSDKKVWFSSSAFTIKGGSGSAAGVNETNGFRIYVYRYLSSSENTKDLISTIDPNGKNFSTTVNAEKDYSTTDGFTTFYLLAEDDAGNTSDPLLISVYVDQTGPSFGENGFELRTEETKGKIEANAYINVSQIYYNYSITEEGSGLKTVTVYEDNTKQNTLYEAENTKSKDTSYTKYLDKLLSQGKHTFYVEAIDNAGNVTSATPSTFIYDTVAPTVAFNSHEADDSINETITIEGSITEATSTVSDFTKWGLDSAVYVGHATDASTSNSSVTYKKIVSEATGDTEIMMPDFKVEKGNSITDFKITGFDTTKLEEGYNFIVVLPTDLAGNTQGIKSSSTNRIRLIVDQDTDRPVITLNNVNVDGTSTISSGTISGTISDDDSHNSAIVSSLEIQVVDDGKTPADDGWESLISGNTDKWSYTLKKTDENGKTLALDGKYQIYFRVKDYVDSSLYSTDTSANNVGNTFTSVATTPTTDDERWKCPIIKYTGSDDEVATAVTFSIDQNPPKIDDVEYATSSSEDSDFSGWEDVSGRITLGGKTDKRYVKFRIPAYDVVSPQSDLTVTLTNTDLGFSYSTKSTDDTKKITLNIFGDTFTESGEAYYYFETPVIDFGGITPTGNFNLSIEAADAADKPALYPVIITVDNTAPDTLNMTKPQTNIQQTGNVVFSGSVDDDKNGSSGVVEMYYVIPQLDIKAATSIKDSDTTEGFGKKWIQIPTPDTGKFVTWEFTLTGVNNLYTQNGTVYNMNTCYASYETVSTGVYNLPIWFKLVDATGNTAYMTDYKILYNPDADKPIVSITYPEHNNTTSKGLSYVTMGGTIRFTGTATDDAEGIDSVYLQFDMDGDGVYENGKNVDGCPSTVTVVDIPNSGDTPQQGVKVNGTQSWNYSLNVSKLSGLAITDDNTKTLNVRAVAVDKGDGTTDSTKLMGAWSQVLHISVSNDVPAFETVDLKQFSSDTDATNTTGTPVKTLSYQADEYLSGNYWYLEETISSTAGIGSVVVQRDGDDLGTIKVTNGSSSDSENPSYSEADYAVTMEDSTATAKITVVKAVTSTVGTITSMTYRIPLDCSGTSCNLNVTVTDTSDNNKSSTANYSLNIDNVAPSFVDKYAESEQAANGTVKIYKNTYGSTLLNSSSPIQNSNGTFTLVGRVSEAGSGYENVIFYFKRSTKDGTNVRVYNPMENHTTSGGSNPGKENRTDITDTTTLEEVTSPTSGQVYFNTDGLPVLYVTDATVDSVGFSVTADAVKDNANIRVGGLVKIGGVYRKITEVDSETGKVGFDIEYRTSSDSESETSVTVTAEFVYGMVIDNSGESSSGSGASATIKNDDGDGMVESYQKSGTNYTWDASINSKNIPDGPIELHVVAFDKAGNASHGYTITSISNNAPRLARVRLTTDLNGNGTYDESEGQIFANSSNDKTKTWTDALDTNTEGVQIWNLTSDSAGTNGWTIKNGLQLEPEFVGGTTPFYYVFSKSAGTGTAMNLTTPKSNTSLAKIAQTTAASDTTDTSLVIGKLVANKDAIQLGNALIDSTAEGGNSDFEGDSSNPKTNTYSFSFWDSTEETTPGSDSQWAVLNLQLNQDIADTVAPTVTVKPFYWKKSSDNSLYADNTEKDNGPDNGHIELEADLPDTFTDAGSGVDDRDPKVSGKIVLRGTAYDDIRLSSIWVKMTDGDTTPVSFNFASSLSTTTYSTGLTTTSDKYDGYALVAFYDSANSDWVIPSATMATNGWEFAIDTSEASGSYFNQTGHKVNWILSLDTSKIGTSESNIVAAAADMTFSVMAVDHVQTTGHISSSTEATSDESDAKYNKPSYRMDVVPYITELTTKLSSIEKKKHSVYGRTALGKYPVYYYTNNNSSTTEGEPITVEGFNLTNGDVYLGTTKVATLSVNSFTIGSTMSSAMLSVKVNGIESLNNKNSNDAKGDYDGVNTNPTGDYDVYSNYYNRQPNNQNNNLLTDDVEIAVWQLNARAAKPSSGRIDAPIMHINPKNGLIGFAFTHGSDLVSYPNGTANSYLNYAKDWTSISQNSLDFVYDANGNMFGVHHGTDTASNNYKASRYKLCTSLWGVTSNWATTADYNTAYGDYNSLRLEYMGYSPDGTSNSNVLSPERITGSKLATSTTSAGTNLYLMYYDSAKDELKFKAGQNVPTSYSHKNSEKNPSSNCYDQSYTYFGDFYDDARLNVGAYNSEYQHITVVSNSSYTAARPSRYFAISVVPASITKTTDVVVAVWYDPKKRNLNYSYFEDPLTGAGSRTTESSTTGTCKTGTSGYWSTPVQILTLDAIGDCAIEVDADGHIHIAAYTRDSGNSVSYTYLYKYNSTYDETKNTVLVDAYDSNGQYLTMDFAKNSNGLTIPYIGYMTSRGYPKYAYLVDTASSSYGSGVMGDEGYYPKAGADENNMTTGAWEFIMVPTTTEINVNVNSKINIGVYRDSDGKLANIPSSISGLSVSAGTSSGVALGNGTSNPVLAYGTNDDGSGFIETAQMK